MKPLSHLFEANARWAEQTVAEDADFFSDLAAIQRPEYLWIGCSDSRVPANQITGLKPGEVFVHRNVANVVVHTDLNCLSVVQYAIDVLSVKHIMVVGHYGCGGIRAALEGTSLGLIDNWLRHIQDVADRHGALMDRLSGIDARWHALCELNVIEQVRNLARTTLVGDAWRRGQDLTLHGWVYGLDDGRLLDLDISSGTSEELEAAYRRAVTEVADRHPAAK